MSLTDLLFGSTAKNAKRELLTYDPELGGRQKDLGDYLGDLFTGQGAVLDKATEDAYVKDLQRTYGNSLSDLEKYGLSSTKITKDTNKTDLDQLITKYADEVKLNKTIDQQAALAGYVPEANTPYQTKLKGLKEFKQQEKLAEEARLRELKKKDSLEPGGSVETAMFNRGIQAQNQAIQMQGLQNQLQSASDQRAIDNRRLDLQESRDARKGQREMLMLIMSGLDNIGKGFA